MTGTAQNKLSRISYLLAEAHDVWDELSDAEKEEVNNLHDEHFSLCHCLRWGEIAASEARDYAENR